MKIALRCIVCVTLPGKTQKTRKSHFRVSAFCQVVQVIWGGTAKRLLIVYFIGNISAKKYQNPVTCVKVIASQRCDVFETRCRNSAEQIIGANPSTTLRKWRCPKSRRATLEGPTKCGSWGMFSSPPDRRGPRIYIVLLNSEPAVNEDLWLCKAVTGLATISARIVIYLMLIRRAGT